MITSNKGVNLIGTHFKENCSLATHWRCCLRESDYTNLKKLLIRIAAPEWHHGLFNKIVNLHIKTYKGA